MPLASVVQKLGYRLIAATLIAVAIAGGVAYYSLFSRTGVDAIPKEIALGNGRVEAVQVDVSTKIPGRVSDIFAREGDLVQPGQVVAQIDTSQLQAQLLRAKADVASAESQVAAAEAFIAQAKAQLTLTEQEVHRSASLVEKGAVTQALHDTRISQRDVAKAVLKAAEATLVSRQRAVDAAQAGVQEIQTQIGDCVLKAPTIGRVLFRLAEPGEVLSAGGKVLTLVNLADVYMEIFLPSGQAHRVNIGSEARIKLDILDFAVPGTVSFVSPESQFTPKQVETSSEREKLMFRVKIAVPAELVRKHIEQVKTGVRGVGYVRLDGGPKPEWPAFLKKLPPDAAAIASSQR
ncbi:HlyD family efflux transporter periplasmic adaptor subunit [Bradyrhizobium sp. LMTR 3]|uniref:HlyD family secretion protein n=1 Tax=Bradyrhizobium sp. LMTR 3 TaxID=189873 RepID=UPI0008109D19|nr:HlyD family efflux transporter periplasmic adaptor subunit [Bradyrhizobium sp. LMTR 3]OCK53599.1 secretion protein HlyD [Bradyrhizobium sp. LMTR 3]